MRRGAFSSPAFRAYFLGGAFAVQGVWFQRVTLGWIGWAITASPAFVGLVSALTMAPTLVAGPLFGVLADRIDIRRAAIASTSAMIVCLMLLAASEGFGLTTPTLLAGMALLIGFVTSAQNPVRMSLAPRLVEHALVPSAVALMALNFNVARLIAPVFAGAVISSAGTTVALWIAVLLYLPMLIVLPGLSPRPLPAEGVRTAFFVALWEGVRHVARAPMLRAIVLMMAVYASIGRGVLEMLPVLADGVFGKGAAGLGVLSAAAGAGALVAAALKSIGVGQRARGVDSIVLVAAVIGLAGVTMLGATASWPVALGLVALIGACGTFVGVSLQATIQADLADELRGRVMSLWVVVGFGTAALGALGLGAAAQWAGLAATLRVSGAVGLIGLLAILGSGLRALRQ